MRKQIVLINGSGGVGKDTFIEYCNLYARTYNVSTVDRVKGAARLLGWEGGKTEKDRKFLSDLKLLAVDYSDHSHSYIKSAINYFLSPENDTELMFIHVREPEEIARFEKEFKCRTLLIKNKNVQQITSNMADSHVEDYIYDFVVNNDEGFAELWEKAGKFVTTIFKEEQNNG